MKAKANTHLLLSVSVIYALILFALVFLKDNAREINLVPFRFAYDYIIHKEPLGFSNIIGNVLLFVPLGILIAMQKISARKGILLILAATFGIELIQYIFCCGISDIDDIILNLIGGIVGIGLYHVMKKTPNCDLKILVLLLIMFTLLIILLFALNFGLFGFHICIF